MFKKRRYFEYVICPYIKLNGILIRMYSKDEGNRKKLYTKRKINNIRDINDPTRFQ